MKKGTRAGAIVIIALLLMAVTFMDTWLVFRMTSRQTKDSGSYRLENISGELENMISKAESLTLRLGMLVEKHIGDYDAVSDFIYGQIDELTKEEIGVFNVYIAGSDWKILPGLADPEHFVPTERDWYKGAAKNPGKTYVTDPYVDVVTGDVCYTVSVMLADGDSVIAVDYTMSTIQNYIKRMYTEGSSDAIISTGEGIIVGCSDETLIGERISNVIPEYVGVFSLAKNNEGVVTGKVKKDGMSVNLFATRSGNGWYMMVGESDWKLYRDSYIQLIVTLGLSLALFGVIIALYLVAVKNQKHAEVALNAKEEFLNGITVELQEPLSRILDNSSAAKLQTVEDYGETFMRIHSAGERLSDMIKQLTSYSSIVKTEKKEHEEAKKKGGVNKHFRAAIILVMALVMHVSLYTNISATYRWGNELMQSEADDYEYRVAEWVTTQKSMLDMFCSDISARPGILKDYDGTIEYLSKVTAQYPEISASYIANPELNPTVYMNTGWTPEPGWVLEERPWYKDTLASETGWSISAPYYDSQTGGYCITFSQKVYDAESGEFLGIFGIDFFMEKLIDILGDSYTNTGYAFLVDLEGDIINHPYGSYQMSQDVTKNVADSPYSTAVADESKTRLIKDYDGSFKILAATENEASRFKVYVVASVWKIYGRVIIYGSICFVAFLLCIIMVYRLLTNLIRWQDETNRRMKESADAAIAAGQSKSRFLAQMSHEIRTPINAVLGMNEMILRESKNPDILDYAENIKSAGRTLLSIINSILDFSKIEDGKMEIIPVKYDLSELINNLQNSILERAKTKKLYFKVDVDESIPNTLMGDDVRITQIIMNLLTNAVKYTEKGGVELKLKNAGQNVNEVELEVEVRDTGIGIRQEDMGKLFESFERIDEKRNRNIEGTGLGMSIVTKLLAMMDSSLAVDSVYGEGSTFSFRIVQGIVDAEPIGDYEKRLESHERTTQDSEIFYAPEARILVVDDNEMNLKVIKSLMKQNGIVPDTCMSGEQCIEQLKKDSYDILFLDHMMPKLDGIETLHRLKREGLVKKEMHVIALTANAINGAKEMYIKEGFEDYLSKPIEVGQLEGMLKKYLPESKISDAWEHDFEDDDERGMGVNTSARTAQNVVSQVMDISKLPPVDGLDWRYAADHLPTVEIMLETAADFAQVLMSQAGKLNGFYSSLADEDGVSSYRIQVHAMKSAAATVGIVPLAGMAKVLEDAACQGDTEKIRRLHGDFVEEWLKYSDKLKCVMPEDASNETSEAYDKDKVKEILSRLKTAMEDFDVDAADECVKELKAYSYPDDIGKKIDEIAVAVKQVDDDVVIRIIEEIM